MADDEEFGLDDLVGAFGAINSQLASDTSRKHEEPFTLESSPPQAPTHPQHPLVDDFLGIGDAGSPAQAISAQSVDLDLLGMPSGGNPAANMAPSAALDADIPLLSPPRETQQHMQWGATASASAASGPLQRSAAGSTSGPGPSAASPARPFTLGGEVEEDAGPSTSAAPPQPLREEPPPVRVWLKDPERNEGPNKLGLRTTYFTYPVRTDSSLPGMVAEGAEVRRRFSEFDALHKIYKAHYRGYIIPPLPDKSFIDSKLAHEDFLRLRRADLQAFLRGIVAHPVLRDAEALRLFLLQPGELTYNPAWLALLQSIGSHPDAHGDLAHGLPSASAAAATTKAAAGLSSLLSWVRHSVMAPGGGRALDEDEQQLRHAKELLKDLQRLLQLSCEAARVACGHMEALAGDLYELGRNMGMTSKWEEALRSQSGTYTEAGFSAAKRAADCKQFSLASARQQGVWKAGAVKTAASLVYLHDYYILMPEAVAALDEREKCLSSIHAMEDDLAAKQAELSRGGARRGAGGLGGGGGAAAAAGAGGRLGSAGGGTPPPPTEYVPLGGGGNARGERRSYTLTSSVERLEEQLKACREQYRLIKQRNLDELRRLHLSREQDFHKMFVSFAAVQAQLMQTSADMWRTAARQFAGEEGAALPVDGDAGEEGEGGEGSVGYPAGRDD